MSGINPAFTVIIIVLGAFTFDSNHFSICGANLLLKPTINCGPFPDTLNVLCAVLKVDSMTISLQFNAKGFSIQTFLPASNARITNSAWELC